MSPARQRQNRTMPMKQFTVVLLLIHAACAQAATPANLLVNGDFAQPVTAGKIPGWVGTGSIETEGAKKLLRLTGPAPRSPMCTASQAGVLPAGSKSVKLELKVRKGHAGNANYEVILEALDADKSF